MSYYKSSTLTMVNDLDLVKHRRAKFTDLSLLNMDESYEINNQQLNNHLQDSFLNRYQEILDTSLDTLNKHEFLKNYLRKLKHKKQQLQQQENNVFTLPTLNDISTNESKLKKSKSFSFVHKHFDVKNQKKRFESINDSNGLLHDVNNYIKYKAEPEISNVEMLNNDESHLKSHKRHGKLLRSLSDRLQKKSYKSLILPTQKLQTLQENDFRDDSKSSMAISPRPQSIHKNEFIDFKNILIAKNSIQINHSEEVKPLMEDRLFTKLESQIPTQQEVNLCLSSSNKNDLRMNSSALSTKQLPKLLRKKSFLSKVQSTPIVPPNTHSIVLNSAKYSESETSVYDSTRFTDIYSKLPRTNSSNFHPNLRQLKRNFSNQKMKLYV